MGGLALGMPSSDLLVRQGKWGRMERPARAMSAVLRMARILSKTLRKTKQTNKKLHTNRNISRMVGLTCY